MTVNLLDLNAFQLLGQLEGSTWVESQKNHPTSPYGFHALKAALLELKASEYADDPDVHFRDFMASSNNVLYGAGGWARFIISRDGTIYLDPSSCPDEKVAKAIALGFNVQRRC